MHWQSSDITLKMYMCVVDAVILSWPHNKLTLKVHLVNFTHSLKYVAFYTLDKETMKQRGAMICTLSNYSNRIKVACADNINVNE